MENIQLYLRALKQYANFKGRATRKEYWIFVLFNTLIGMFLIIIDTLLFKDSLMFKGAYILSCLYFVNTLIPSLAVLVRRLHDIGKSSWWTCIAVIPFLGVIYLIFLLIKKDESEKNKYGENPKEHELYGENEKIVNVSTIMIVAFFLEIIQIILSWWFMYKEKGVSYIYLRSIIPIGLLITAFLLRGGKKNIKKAAIVLIVFSAVRIISVFMMSHITIHFNWFVLLFFPLSSLMLGITLLIKKYVNTASIILIIASILYFTQNCQLMFSLGKFRFNPIEIFLGNSWVSVALLITGISCYCYRIKKEFL